MNLKNYLASKAITEFAFSRITHTVAEQSGEKIAVLWLTNPIPTVQGSQTISDDATGEKARIEAYDVESVRLFERDFEAEGIEVNEDGTGTVKCDLKLDVSNAGEVWLTSTSFAAFGRAKRLESGSNRRSGILTRMSERKAAATFKGTDVNAAAKPEVVSGP